MPADIVDYQILGEDLQGLVITLDPGEAVVAEAGSMMYMQDGIEMATQLSMSQHSKGVFGKLFEAGKRAVTGDSFFITYFANTAQTRRDVAFAAPYPGHIVPLELADYGGTIICQKDAFLCGARGVEITIAFNKRIGVGLFGGEGFILQKIFSPDRKGQAFLHAGGTVVQMKLAPRRKPQGRHRLPRRFRAHRQLRHPDGPGNPKQNLRRRGPVLRQTHRARDRLAPDAPLLPAGRPNHRRRPFRGRIIQRRRLGARRAWPNARRKLATASTQRHCPYLYTGRPRSPLYHAGATDLRSLNALLR